MELASEEGKKRTDEGREKEREVCMDGRDRGRDRWMGEGREERG